MDYLECSPFRPERATGTRDVVPFLVEERDENQMGGLDPRAGAKKSTRSHGTYYVYKTVTDPQL